jgi:hypothetical protein
MVMNPAGLGPEEDCSSNCELQTRPLSREGVTRQQTRNCLKKIEKQKELVRGPRWVPDAETVAPGGVNHHCCKPLRSNSEIRVR